MFERAWGVDPYTRGYIPAGRRATCAAGPLHGTHEPPFFVAGSDHWVAGYMEGAVRTGPAEQRPPRSAARLRSPLSRETRRSPRPRSRASAERRRGARAPAGSLSRRSGPDAEAVEQRKHAVGDIVGIAALELAAPARPARISSANQVAQPRVELLGDRPQLRVAHRAQPQLDPQHPVLVERFVRW